MDSDDGCLVFCGCHGDQVHRGWCDHRVIVRFGVFSSKKIYVVVVVMFGAVLRYVVFVRGHHGDHCGDRVVAGDHGDHHA